MNQTQNHAYVCPCCGYYMFPNPPGSYEICEICYWEDEDLQLAQPERPDGANEGISLEQAQDNFARIGACTEDCAKYVRKPLSTDLRDPEWRKYDRTLDRGFTFSIEEPYYWRRTRGPKYTEGLTAS